MVMLQINITSIRSLVLFLALTTIHAQNECLGGSANCINIRNCPQIISILTGPTPPSAEMLQTLRNLQCGFESNDPKYCCNQVTTTTTTTVKPEIETPRPPDITNHPNLRLLDHQACGPVPQRRAIGGNETEIFQYPWMTIILYDTKGTIRTDRDIYCSGTIISSRYVLTAAQCFYVQDYTVKSVRVGDHDRSKERDCMTDNKGLEIVCAGKYQDYDVDSIHPHPEYTLPLSTENNLHADIGLIRLIGSIDFRPQNVKPICLPFGTAATLNHKRAIVTGWRTRNEKLLQAKFWLVTNERCKKIYGDLHLQKIQENIIVINYVNPDITYKMLCAGGQENEDTCTSERGGPLQAAGIYNGGTVRIIQHGVCNYVLNCHRREHPEVFIRVSYYMDWILNTMTD